MCLVREEVLIEGNVQSVGFRAFIKSIADHQGIVGSAQNIHPVRIICEGEEESLDSFLNEIQETSPEYINIENIDIYDKKIIEELSFKSFEIIEDKPEDITLKDIYDRLQVGVGVMHSMNDKLDKLDKIDTKLGKLDKIDTKLDKIYTKLDKLDSIETGQKRMIELLEDNNKNIITFLERISHKI